VIQAPFRADEAAARRFDELDDRVGAAIGREVAELVARPPADALGGSTIPIREVERLLDRHGLDSARQLALLALPVARAMARPPISGYRVAAVGVEAPSGDLVLGANLEFPGSDLGTTIHAEGFVALRARRRGGMLATLAVTEAHPCAHCRQTLAESSAASELAIVDPLGHELTLADLYPWPFQPTVLGDPGDVAGLVAWPGLAFADDAPPDVAAALLDVGLRAHRARSRCGCATDGSSARAASRASPSTPP